MRYGLLILALTTSLLFVQQGSADAEPRLDVQLSANELLPGESVSLRVELEWRRGSGNYQVEFPDLKLTNLSVSNRGKSQEIFKRSNEDWVRDTLRWELKAPLSGVSMIAPFEIRYLDAETGEAGELFVREQRLTIRKLVWYENIWMWFGAAFVAMMAGLLVYRRMHPHAVPEVVVAPPTAEERCMQLIREMDGYSGVVVPRDLMEQLDQQFHEYLRDFHVEEKGEKHLIAITNRFHQVKYSGMSLTREDFLSLKNELMHYVDGKRVVGAQMQKEENE
ncbi:MAG: hypothetical protein Q8R76_08550 [Candidatus Omnitrophota bacterium]|nr:hypothetical protein [Candidatus Omnitrophota bacterium]